MYATKQSLQNFERLGTGWANSQAVIASQQPHLTWLPLSSIVSNIMVSKSMVICMNVLRSILVFAPFQVYLVSITCFFWKIIWYLIKYSRCTLNMYYYAKPLQISTVNGDYNPAPLRTMLVVVLTNLDCLLIILIVVSISP